MIRDSWLGYVRTSLILLLLTPFILLWLIFGLILLGTTLAAQLPTRILSRKNCAEPMLAEKWRDWTEAIMERIPYI